ncbi:hypothetical protein EYF80_000343 [Liparis tanakae]|uniref:Uncharacterized protein n=1 Tax=Liparis tanakae TaxID=230148 RepID=A0A4Z2JHS7_9TELE|nr:hypothetical protein EYF80_000343 [Liparis tanakae]
MPHETARAERYGGICLKLIRAPGSDCRSDNRRAEPEVVQTRRCLEEERDATALTGPVARLRFEGEETVQCCRVNPPEQSPL